MRMSQARIATVIILMFTCLLTHTAFGQRQKPDYIWTVALRGRPV